MYPPWLQKILKFTDVKCLKIIDVSTMVGENFKIYRCQTSQNHWCIHHVWRYFWKLGQVKLMLRIAGTRALHEKKRIDLFYWCFAAWNYFIFHIFCYMPTHTNWEFETKHLPNKRPLHKNSQYTGWAIKRSNFKNCIKSGVFMGLS